jgi:hypothetical protein
LRINEGEENAGRDKSESKYKTQTNVFAGKLNVQFSRGSSDKKGSSILNQLSPTNATDKLNNTQKVNNIQKK